VSASGQRRLALEHLGCGYSNPAHTHATIKKHMFVLYNTSRCNSCLTAGPKNRRNVSNYKTNKTCDYHKTNSPTCSLLGHRTPSDILWAFGGKPKASALPPNRSSRRCLRLPPSTGHRRIPWDCLHVPSPLKDSSTPYSYYYNLFT